MRAVLALCGLLLAGPALAQDDGDSVQRLIDQAADLAQAIQAHYATAADFEGLNEVALAADGVVPEVMRAVDLPIVHALGGGVLAADGAECGIGTVAEFCLAFTGLDSAACAALLQSEAGFAKVSLIGDDIAPAIPAPIDGAQAAALCNAADTIVILGFRKRP